MTDARRSMGEAFWASVFIGAYAGVSLQMAITFWGEPVDPAERWTIPVLLIGYGLFAVPFVALGLALLGLPVARSLGRLPHHWWVGVIAALWSCVAGKLMFYAIDHLLFFGLYDITQVSLLDMGVIYGLPTGLAWWALHRRQLSSL
jgi:hypothetical protein